MVSHCAPMTAKAARLTAVKAAMSQPGTAGPRSRDRQPQTKRHRARRGHDPAVTVRAVEHPADADHGLANRPRSP